MSAYQDASAANTLVDDPTGLASRYYRALEEADETRLRGLLAPGFVLNAGGGRLGVEAYLTTLAEYRTGFPDLAVKLANGLRDGPWIAIRTVTTGTHTGPFLGHAATHRRFSSAGADFMRIRDGRILEIESHFDVIGMLSQLGLYEAGRR